MKDRIFEHSKGFFRISYVNAVNYMGSVEYSNNKIEHQVDIALSNDDCFWDVHLMFDSKEDAMEFVNQIKQAVREYQGL